VLAAPMAAIMSTVDSLLLLVSSTIVKDVYINYVKPEASNQRIKRLSIGITGVLGVIVFLMALNPPNLIICLNLFAFVGMEAAFIGKSDINMYHQHPWQPVLSYKDCRILFTHHLLHHILSSYL